MSIVSEALKKIQEERSATMGDVCEKTNVNVSHNPPPKMFSSDKRRSSISRILIVMVITGIFIFAGYIFFVQKEKAPKTSSAAVAQNVEGHERNAAVPRSDIRNTNMKAIQLPLPKLSGIMYTSHNPQSIIDGRVVQEGDTVNDYLVVKISPDRVNISRDNEDFELKL